MNIMVNGGDRTQNIPVQLEDGTGCGVVFDST
jgi:hypothetical protein